MAVDPRRARLIKDGKALPGPVVYWMQRDNRAEDNWALLYAQEKAIRMKQPLNVAFCLDSRLFKERAGAYRFLLEGLEEVSSSLSAKNISFYIIDGQAPSALPVFLSKHRASLLVGDFNPLRFKKAWVKEISRKIDIPYYEVDAHNIVPAWLASNKKEFSARTFRPKISAWLPDFLTVFPKLRRHPYGTARRFPAAAIRSRVSRFQTGGNIAPGSRAGLERLDVFIEGKLPDYGLYKNDPNKGAVSGLSPYFHFGQVAPQRAALEIKASRAPLAAKQVFLEELIVRRELADNFCLYEPEYDNIKGAPDWARRTLSEHSKDKRDYRYSLPELEKGKTHDPLWNAAQQGLAKSGSMHGYMRMYWAKKILEWSPSPKEAIKRASYLNDTYALDGRDPDGYAGIMWSIAGLHDRPWFSRPVFGQVRYMSYSGCASKFDVKRYIDNINNVSL